MPLTIACLIWHFQCLSVLTTLSIFHSLKASLARQQCCRLIISVCGGRALFALLHQKPGPSRL